MKLLNTLLLKLGYRRTHWTDKIKDKLYEIFWMVANGLTEGNTWTEDIDVYKVTLSVKKMKK